MPSDAVSNDVALLHRLGYKQEFKRHFSIIETFGVSFTIIGLVPSITSVIVFALPNGGAVSLVWGWAVASIFIIFISLALAELGSAAPTSGGLYYWTHKFASPNTRNLLAWICGYSNTIYLIAGTASITWSCAVQIFACVTIGTNFEFAATTGRIYGLFAGLILLESLLASLATKALARLQRLFIFTNLSLILVIIVALAAATPSEFRNPASFAFGNFVNFYGWPDGYAFILGLLAPLWTIGGFDAAVHISEEASNANKAVPIAMVTAPTMAAILGFAVNIAVAFCMGNDIEGLLASPIGQPMATILLNSFGEKGTLAFFSFVIIAEVEIGCALMIASSRQIFAFARDGALPFSSVLYRVNSSTTTPVNCVWFGSFIALLLGLLAFAGPAAIGAIFSLGVAAQYLAYSIPIACRVFFKTHFKPGPFSLGRLGIPISIIALVWMAFIIVVFFFPTTPTVTADTMNYTVVVLGGWIILSLVWYYFPVYGGVNWFTGPVSTTGKGGSMDTDSSDDVLGSASMEKELDMMRP